MAKKSGQPKGHRKNPLITWVSTDAERLAHKPKVKLGVRKVRVSFLDWLKHLESSKTFKGRQKSDATRKRDLATLKKFWNVAQGRLFVKKLFADPRVM